MPLTREQILALTDLPREEVQAPEWGGSVWVCTMSGTERDRFESEFIALKNSSDDDDDKDSDKSDRSTENIRARLAVRTVCDEAGNLLFTEADIAALGKTSGKVLGRIFDVAQRLNGIGKQEVEELKGN